MSAVTSGVAKVVVEAGRERAAVGVAGAWVLASVLVSGVAVAATLAAAMVASAALEMAASTSAVAVAASMAMEASPAAGVGASVLMLEMVVRWPVGASVAGVPGVSVAAVAVVSMGVGCGCRRRGGSAGTPRRASPLGSRPV